MKNFSGENFWDHPLCKLRWDMEDNIKTDFKMIFLVRMGEA